MARDPWAGLVGVECVLGEERFRRRDAPPRPQRRKKVQTVVEAPPPPVEEVALVEAQLEPEAPIEPAPEVEPAPVIEPALEPPRRKNGLRWLTSPVPGE